jgi:hypothetical protein
VLRRIDEINISGFKLRNDLGCFWGTPKHCQPDRRLNEAPEPFLIRVPDVFWRALFIFHRAKFLARANGLSDPQHEFAFALMMNRSRPFLRWINPGLEDFQNEEVVF